MNRNPDNVVDFVLQHYSGIAKKLKALRLTEAETYQIIDRIFNVGEFGENRYYTAVFVTLSKRDFLHGYRTTDFSFFLDLSFTLNTGKRVYIALLGGPD